MNTAHEQLQQVMKIHRLSIHLEHIAARLISDRHFHTFSHVHCYELWRRKERDQILKQLEEA